MWYANSRLISAYCTEQIQRSMSCIYQKVIVIPPVCEVESSRSSRRKSVSGCCVPPSTFLIAGLRRSGPVLSHPSNRVHSAKSCCHRVMMMSFVGFGQPRVSGLGNGNHTTARTRDSRRGNIRASLSNKTRSPHATFDIDSFSKLLYESQQLLCTQIEEVDGQASFSVNPWKSDTGEGKARVLQQGKVFEKAGVNVSVVHGRLSQTRADAMTSRGRKVRPGSKYNAAALSFVFHAQSPFIPTLRGDVRVFVSENSYWGGGGVDLTIFYVDRPQFARFHSFWKDICDRFDPSLYPQFKKQCDEYFYIPSRGEHRGIGGLFYDDVPLPENELVLFQAEMLKHFFDSYYPILESQRGRPWTEEEKRWQRIRRGRYLEFNLLNDRGVRFGLSGANLDMDHIDDPAFRSKVSRTDSIMISAPPSVEWPFGYSPAPGSREEETLKLLQSRPVDWVHSPTE